MQLRSITLGDTAQAWESLGFDVRSDGNVPGRVRLGNTVVVLSGTGGGFLGWDIDGVETDLDGLEAVDGYGPAPQDQPMHPNGIERIDHVVVRSGDIDRTVAAFAAAGLEVRSGRSTTSYGAPMRQAFLWAGDVILEVVGPDEGQPTADGRTTVFGLALVAQDLDATVASLGDLAGSPKRAVQAGRRIAGLRGGDVGVSLPLAVMSPHVG